MCRALGSKFAVDKLRLTVDDKGRLSAQTSQVEKLGEGLFRGRKGDMWYMMERIDDSPERKEWWVDFLRTERQLSRRPDLMSIVKSDGGLTAIDLGGYVEQQWVVYATPDMTGTRAAADRTEMYMTAMTDSEAPMVTHMGIQRAFQYVEAGNTRHANLSVGLHSFAARVWLDRDPSKLYLITQPMEGMRTILKRALPFNTYEGSSLEKAIREIGIDKYNFEYDVSNDMSRRTQRELTPQDSPIVDFATSDDFQIQIMDRSRRHVIFDYSQKKDRNIFDLDEPSPKHAWFTTGTMSRPPSMMTPYFTADLFALAENF